MPEDDPPEPRPRTAREVIDAAVRENRGWERLGIGLTAATGATGIVLLIAGAVQGGWLLGGFGVAASGFLMPALVAARRSQRENIRIRLLELSLQKAKTAAEVARITDAVFAAPAEGGPTDATR